MGTSPLTGPATEYIAGELRAEMARRSWTLDQASEQSGLPRSTVNRALKGKTALAVETFITLGLTFGMDVGAVLDRAASVTITEADDVTLAAWEGRTSPTPEGGGL